MTGLRTVRALTLARAAGSGPAVSASVELTVDGASRQALDVRFATPCRRPVELEKEVAASFAEVEVPAALRERLAVESGHVRSTLHRSGAETLLFTREYRLALCRGVILEGGDDGRFRFPWTGSLEPGDLDPSLPLVLGPSAVLALVSYALEVTGSHVEGRSASPAPSLTVLDTAASPYPPQHHPFDSDGSESPDQLLIEDGLWRDRQERTGEGFDPLFVLLTRPDRALRPIAAATRFNRRNLAVRCTRQAAPPATAILIDSWRVRVGPRSGPVPFHAELSRLLPGGERLAVTAVVGLRLDPWQVLARVQGAGGPAAPAVDEDPIEGDNYGSAPCLVTDLALADLLEG